MSFVSRVALHCMVCLTTPSAALGPRQPSIFGSLPVKNVALRKNCSISSRGDRRFRKPHLRDLAGSLSLPAALHRRQLTSVTSSAASSTCSGPALRPCSMSTCSGVLAGTPGKTGRPPGSTSLPARERWKASNPIFKKRPNTPVPPLIAIFPVVTPIFRHASSNGMLAGFQTQAFRMLECADNPGVRPVTIKRRRRSEIGPCCSCECRPCTTNAALSSPSLKKCASGSCFSSSGMWPFPSAIMPSADTTAYPSIAAPCIPVHRSTLSITNAQGSRSFPPAHGHGLQSTLLPSLRTTGAGPGARKAQRSLPSRSYGSWGKRKCRLVLDQRGHGQILD